MPNDSELLRRYVEDSSQTAFTEVVQRYVNLVYASALRRTGGSSHLAADITQQVFTELGKNAARLSRHTMLIGWLYTSTRYVAAKVLRAEQRRKRYERAAVQSADDFSQAIQWEALRPVIDQMLDSLRVDDRDILLQRYVADRTFREVGFAIGVTEEAARKRVDRALEKLREVADKFGIRSTENALGLLLESNFAGVVGLGAAAAISALAVGASRKNAEKTLAWHFMAHTKIISATLGAALIVGSGLCLRQIRAAQFVSEQLAETSRTQAKLKNELKAASARQARVATTASALADQAGTDAPRAETTDNLSGVATAALVRDPIEVGKDFVRARPEALLALAEYTRAQVLNRYGQLFKNLGVSSAQIDRFVDITGQGPGGGFIWHTDDREGAGAFGFGTLSLDETSAQMRLDLGEKNYAALIEYDRLARARDVTEQLGSETYFTESPLTSAQAQAFTRLVAANSVSFVEGKKVGSINWDGVIAGASTVLSPEQVSALQTMDRQRVAESMINHAVAEAIIGARAAIANTGRP